MSLVRKSLAAVTGAAMTAAFAGAIGLVTAGSAQAAFVAFDYTGLAFNKSQQDHDEPPASNDPPSTDYTHASRSGNTNMVRQQLRDTGLGDIGQFVYTLFVPDTNVVGNGWSTLDGAFIEFGAGTKALMMDGVNAQGSLQPSGELWITGGRFDIFDLTGDGAEDNALFRQDLPFGFGQNITEVFYLISGFLEFEFVLGDGLTYTGTWEIDDSKNTNGTFARLLDPRNGGNGIENDLAFFLESISEDFTCINTETGASAACTTYNHDQNGPNFPNRLAINLMGWGDDGEDDPR